MSTKLCQIFFPRSAETEYAVKQASQQKTLDSRHLSQAESQAQRSQIVTQQSINKSPISYTSEYPYPSAHDYTDNERLTETPAPVILNHRFDIADYTPSATFSPNRRLASGATIQGNVTVMSLNAQNLARLGGRSSVNPLVSNFTSPIGESD